VTDQPPLLPGFPHDEVADPAFVGMSNDRLLTVLRRFRRQQRHGGFPGGQIAVRRHGRLVLDAAVGICRGYLPEHDEDIVLSTTTTPFPCFSAGKAVIAIVIAMLEERGLLDPDAPVAEVFPEFARNGKERITVHDVLTHRGGILMPDLCGRFDAWGDWDAVIDAMVAAEPSLERGKLAYHPLEYGWVLSEVCRRADGRPLPTFVTEEITGPAGLPGLRWGVSDAELDVLGRSYWLGAGPFRIAGLDISRVFEAFSVQPELMTMFLPGAGLVSDAASLAAFYEILVGGGKARDGRRIIGRDAIRAYTTRAVRGWDRTNNAPIVLGRGFFLGTTTPGIYGYWGTRDCFGHAGAFCTLAWGDHATGLSAAIVTNGNRSPFDLVTRMMPLAEGLRKACR